MAHIRGIIKTEGFFQLPIFEMIEGRQCIDFSKIFHTNITTGNIDDILGFHVKNPSQVFEFCMRDAENFSFSTFDTKPPKKVAQQISKLNPGKKLLFTYADLEGKKISGHYEFLDGHLSKYLSYDDTTKSIHGLRLYLMCYLMSPWGMYDGEALHQLNYLIHTPDENGLMVD